MSVEITVETTGIESEVVDGDLEPLGHVLMLDYDDADLETIRRDLERIDGPTVLVASSPGSWHVYALALRSWDDVVLELEESNASREYVREMTRRGVATLRIGPKRAADGEIEAGAPVPLAVAGGPRGPTPVSRPHTAQLRQLAEKRSTDGVVEDLEAIETGAIDDVVPVGEQLARSRYETRAEVRS